MTDYLVIYESGEAGWGAYSPDLPGVAVAWADGARAAQRRCVVAA